MTWLEKYKRYWVLVGTIIALVISYQFAFKKTIEAWQLNRQLHKQEFTVTDISLQPAFAERQYQSVTRLTNSYHTDSATYRTLLLKKLGPLADSLHLILTDVPQGNTIADGKLFQQRIQLTGNFFSLLEFYQSIETHIGLGYIQSAQFQSNSKQNSNDLSKDINLMLYLNTLK